MTSWKKNWGQVIGNAVNAGVQTYGELRQGQIMADKERLAAYEEAEVIDAVRRATYFNYVLDGVGDVDIAALEHTVVTMARNWDDRVIEELMERARRRDGLRRAGLRWDC